MEQRAGGLPAAHGLCGQPGGADERLIPGPAVRHAAQDLPGPAGPAAVQTAAGRRHGPEEGPRQDVSEARGPSDVKTGSPGPQSPY